MSPISCIPIYFDTEIKLLLLLLLLLLLFYQETKAIYVFKEQTPKNTLIILYAVRVVTCLGTSRFSFSMVFIFSPCRYTTVSETATNDDITCQLEFLIAFDCHLFLDSAIRNP